MLQYLSLILLAFAVSLDSFSVGLTYGLRKMKIPLRSICIIALCSALTLMVAMGAGELIASVLSVEWAERIGGIILVFIGAWVLYQFFRPDKDQTQSESNDRKMLVKLEIKSLGIVIHILRKPMEADIDRSGTITGIEAILLGAALSLDAFGAGIGAALLGYSPFVMAAAVAAMSSVFLFVGIKCGQLLSHSSWVQKFSFLPGLLLIMIGIWKI
ncbi:putative sporulation protein YtaF [Bacillus mesophilus]|uniref:Sporulation membrane protein YtaF n=1 Tax=Bacillus mesophilus TaxID=1808955 RepID=A0A6M0Q6E0_9BACI|nr:sporulation membrane protein YtaF [Bacillus mesophilus]MBM7660579.1 putative sporulation protein YtaF [Bacillus mesophilus]NEY71873.1 sporulation membrane protein YtaF [Bacillus mesophilus]